MDPEAIRRAQDRINQAAAGRVDPAALDATLERAREQVEALAATAAELESTLPLRVGDAVQDGLRAQVLPVGRNLAEIRGLMNQDARACVRCGVLLGAKAPQLPRIQLFTGIAFTRRPGSDPTEGCAAGCADPPSS